MGLGGSKRELGGHQNELWESRRKEKERKNKSAIPVYALVP